MKKYRENDTNNLELIINKTLYNLIKKGQTIRICIFFSGHPC
jgi:hypothetical protein